MVTSSVALSLSERTVQTCVTEEPVHPGALSEKVWQSPPPKCFSPPWQAATHVAATSSFVTTDGCFGMVVSPAELTAVTVAS